jgi:hypothetical protein
MTQYPYLSGARELKKTTTQVLRVIRQDEIASMAREDIRSENLVYFEAAP